MSYEQEDTCHMRRTQTSLEVTWPTVTKWKYKHRQSRWQAQQQKTQAVHTLQPHSASHRRAGGGTGWGTAGTGRGTAHHGRAGGSALSHGQLVQGQLL